MLWVPVALGGPALTLPVGVSVARILPWGPWFMLAATVVDRALAWGLLVGPHRGLAAVVWVSLSFLGCPFPVGGGSWGQQGGGGA